MQTETTEQNQAQKVAAEPAGGPETEPKKCHREGHVARAIEQQTAKMPSDFWLWGAFGSMGLSAFFKLTGQEKHANFVGLWAPTLLIFGIYNKLVKLQGSDGV